jgi:hypothetical protein
MERKLLSSVLVFLLLIGLTGLHPADPTRLDLYLLIGQSNMAGRGSLSEGDTNPDPNLWVINSENKWVPAVDPLHFDKPTVVGVGPGMAFAKTVQAAHPKRKVGLIPCAVGGSGIDDWQPGVKHGQTGIYAYDAMLERVKLARQSGRLKGILWHQGENDSRPDKRAQYEEKLTAFFARVRKDLNCSKTPILIGTLADFYTERNPEGAKINSILTNYAASHPNVYVASSADLTHKGDSVHFDTQSAQELGRRFARAFLERK